MQDRELLELIVTKIGDQVTKIKEGQQRLEGQFGELKDSQQRLESEFGELKDSQQRLESEFGELKEGQQRLENTVIRMEHSQGVKLDALFDGWKQNTDQLERHNKCLEAIESKLEKQEVEITVIKGKKKLV